VKLSQPSTQRRVIGPLANNAQNSMGAVSAQGQQVLRLDPLFARECANHIRPHPATVFSWMVPVSVSLLDWLGQFLKLVDDRILDSKARAYLNRPP